jgi:predicted TIM-barrel fold metal-dependent hydrolase
MTPDTATGDSFRYLISADNHVTEPFDLWKRLPDDLRQLAPHLEVRDGRTCWVVEGRTLMRFPVPRALRRDTRWGEGDEIPESEELGRLTEEEQLHDMLSSGARDPDSRLKDLDGDGIWAEVMYPNNLVFVLYRLQKPELQIAMCRLYNDWLIDTFGGNERFVPIATLPVLDIDASIAELQRTTAKGFRGAALPVHPDECDRPYNHPDYEPLWTKAAESGIPLHFHAGSGREQRPARNPGGAVINYVVTVAGAHETVCYLTGSGVLARHPELRVAMVECGSGWLAWVLHAMDDAYREHHDMVNPKLDMLPSEYFRRQGYVTFQNDPVGLHNVTFTGKDCLMWGSDYPHPEGTWPRSAEYLAAQMRDVPHDVRLAVLWQNAAKLYDIRLPAESGVAHVL